MLGEGGRVELVEDLLDNRGCRLHRRHPGFLDPVTLPSTFVPLVYSDKRHVSRGR